MSRILDVYMHGDLVGKLVQGKSGGLSFAYDAAYITAKKWALSISLPVQEETFEGNQVRAFFSGLLPDDLVRHTLAKYLGVSDKNPFALLEAIGGECAGALSLYPEGTPFEESKDDDVEILDDKKLKEILDLLKRRPLLAGEDGIRLSLAGAQDKLAVGFKDGQVALIKGTTPTTHILKPLIERVEDSVHNEYFCMRLAKIIGIDVPHVDMHVVENMPCFLIERYDRVIHEDGTVTRLHQEDFCQALGILPEIKYEREGGPNIADCQNLIKSHAARPAVDRIKLLERVIFNYLIGNADAHGKNFSFLYQKRKPDLAPAYDLLSTAIYPDLSDKMAMKIGGKYKPNDVFLRHWYKLIPDTKAAQRNLGKQLVDLAHKTNDHAHALKDSLEKKGIKSPVFEQICTVIKNNADDIFEQLK